MGDVMMPRCSIVMAAIVTLFVNSVGAAPCFDPLAGENQWRMIARIGVCVSDIGVAVSAIDDTVLQIEEDLLSVSDDLCSKILALEEKIDDLNLASSLDHLMSQIEVVSSTVDVVASQADELIVTLSIVEKLSETILQNISFIDQIFDKTISAIDSSTELLCSKIEKVDADVLSVGDVLTADIAVVDADLLSVSDVLMSKIMAIDADNDALLLSISDALTADISIVDANLLSIGEVLNSRIEQIDSYFYSSTIDATCDHCGAIVWDSQLLSNVSIPNSVLSVSQTSDSRYVVIAQNAAANAGNKVEIYSQDSLSSVVGTLNDALSDVVTVRFSPILTPSNTYLLAVTRRLNVGVNPELLMYEFDPVAATLTLVDSVNLDANVNAVTWRPSGDRLLVAQDVVGSELLLYTVNTITGGLTFNSSLSLSGSVVFDQAMDWNPVYTEYAIATTNIVGLNPNAYVILFDVPATSMSIEVISSYQAPVTPLYPKWHPSGNYVASAILEGSVGIAQFIPAASFIGLAAISVGVPVRTVAWNPHGTLIAYGSDLQVSGDELGIHCFSASSLLLEKVAGYSFAGGINNIWWGPSGNLAVGAGFAGGGISLYSLKPLLLDTIANLSCAVLDCCEMLNSKIDGIVTPCSSQPIFSGDITLDDQGVTYCLAENMNGNITIDNRDITVNLNGHVVFGTIIVTDFGSNATIRNGTINAPSPVDNTQAAFGIVHVAGNASGVQIIECRIENGGVGADSVNAYDSINVNGANCLIRDCVIVSGNGGQGAISGIGGNGGNSVVIQNDVQNTRILNSQLQAGFGGTDNALILVSTGNGGSALIDRGNETLVQGCILEGGNGASLFADGSSIADGISIILGNGGAGIVCSGFGYTMSNCTVRGGNGGSANTNTSGDIATNAGIITTGLGGDGFYNVEDLQVTISDCEIYGGQSGPLSSAASIASAGGQFIVSRAGHGLFNESNGDNTAQSTISRTVIRGGSSGFVNTNNGNIGTVGVTSTVDISGSGVQSLVYNLVLVNCDIIGGAGSDVRTGSGTIAEVIMEHGGHGVFDAGTNTCIKNCSIKSGYGGSLISATLGDIFAPSLAGDGGHAVMLGDSHFALIEYCELIAARGGNSFSDDGNTSTGGAGGIGVYVSTPANGTQIRFNSVGPTGASGNVTGIGGTSQNGGDGIRISADAGANNSIEVSNCEISFTGQVGIASTPSTSPGQAIRDSSINAMIYRNYAHDIADTVNRYTLAVNVPIVAVDAPSGTAFALGVDGLANIYR